MSRVTSKAVALVDTDGEYFDPIDQILAENEARVARDLSQSSGLEQAIASARAQRGNGNGLHSTVSCEIGGDAMVCPICDGFGEYTTRLTAGYKVVVCARCDGRGTL